MEGKKNEPDSLIGLVRGSVKQASRIAADHALKHPEAEVVIKRGDKVLERVDAKSLAALARDSAA